jgi:hypothetical protein
MGTSFSLTHEDWSGMVITMILGEGIDQQVSCMTQVLSQSSVVLSDVIHLDIYGTLLSRFERRFSSIERFFFFFFG